MSPATCPPVFVIVLGSLLLIGELHEEPFEGGERRGPDFLVEPMQLMPVPSGAGLGWICVPLPTSRLELVEWSGTRGVPAPWMLEQYGGQLAQMKADAAGLSLPRQAGPRRVH